MHNRVYFIIQSSKFCYLDTKQTLIKSTYSTWRSNVCEKDSSEKATQENNLKGDTGRKLSPWEKSTEETTLLTFSLRLVETEKYY